METVNIIHNAEELLIQWKEYCKEKIKIHETIAIRKSRERLYVGIPTLCVPFVFGIVTLFVDDDEKVFSSLGFLTSGLMNTIFGFLKFEKNIQDNDKAANEYKEVLYKIEKSLLPETPNKHIILDEIISHIKTLDTYSPVPNQCCS